MPNAIDDRANAAAGAGAARRRLAAATILAGAALLAACQPKLEDTTPEYVTPYIYDNLSCAELVTEKRLLQVALDRVLAGEAGPGTPPLGAALAIGIPRDPVTDRQSAGVRVADLRGRLIAATTSEERQACPGSATDPALLQAASGPVYAPAADYTEAELAAFCAQPWEERTLSDGRIERNPCPTR
ncbi:MAG: hypothetical protein AAF677_17000 [Pseudomonadota bacterium]